MAEQHDHPTVKTKIPMDVAGYVEGLRKAMKGMGTDEATIINLLTSCSSDQRQVVLQQYQSTFSRDLVKDLKKELTGHFEDIILVLMTRRNEYLAQQLHHACKKKNANTMIEMLCTAENSTIKSIKSAYERLFDSSLEEALTEATTETFQAVMLGMAAAERSDTYNEELSHSVAKKLYNDGLGLEEEELVKVLCKYSFRQLREVLVEYYKQADRTLGDTFDCQYTGNNKTYLKEVFQCLDNRFAFLAEELHKAMAGSGTRDQDLIRLVVTRSEIDLGNIKTEYENMYNKPLSKDIKGDTSGDYKKILLALLDE
ncbi:annexin A13-like [Homarus americanus]|uniref:Annexin A7-like n=1 Tax=Homarus americanus TaxID=6706 RepID=A0A8J5MR00_HOMAM|nr:annexin A13-like [Homarus americanus]KAG7160132.1 Annexin A7-like [Homarus americanus]